VRGLRAELVLRTQGRVTAPVRILCLLVSGLLLLTLSCPRTRQKEPLVDGFLFKEVQFGGTSYDRWVEVYDTDGIPQIPIAKLNGKSLDMVSWNPIHAIYEQTDAFKTDTTYDLTVDHYWGRAHARITMPADFRVTRPDTLYVYNRDSLLIATWQRSRGATWYWLNLYLDYDFLDTVGDYDYYEFDQDTVVYDTFCVYERNRFFPWYVRTILEGEAEFLNWACDGPQEAPGALGNIQGDGYGYVMSANQPREAHFIVVSPPAQPMDRNALMERAKMKFLNRLRRMTGVSDSLDLPHGFRP